VLRLPLLVKHYTVLLCSSFSCNKHEDKHSPSLAVSSWQLLRNLPINSVVNVNCAIS